MILNYVGSWNINNPTEYLEFTCGQHLIPWKILISKIQFGSLLNGISTYIGYLMPMLSLLENSWDTI